MKLKEREKERKERKKLIGLTITPSAPILQTTGTETFLSFDDVITYPGLHLKVASDSRYEFVVLLSMEPAK